MDSIITGAFAVAASFGSWIYVSSSDAAKRVSEALGILSSNHDFDDLFNTYCQKYSSPYELDPLLIKTLCYYESNLIPNKRNGSFYGLGQMSEATWDYTWTSIIGIDSPDFSNIYDPDHAIEAVCAYYSYLLKRFGGLNSLAVVSYNVGETKVAKTLKSYSNNVDVTVSQVGYTGKLYVSSISEILRQAEPYRSQLV